MGKRTILGSIVSVTLAFGSLVAAQATTRYTEQVVATITLPGHSEKGDVVAVDPGANKVYVAQQGNNAIDVIDAKTNTLEATIHGIKKGYGVTYDRNYVFAASTRDSAVYVISKDNWKILKKLL